MNSAGERNAIAHRIGTAFGNGSDVCGLHFGATTAIDYAQPCDRACLPIGSLDRCGERCVAEWTRDDLFHNWSLKLSRFLSHLVYAAASRGVPLSRLHFFQNHCEAGLQDCFKFEIVDAPNSTSKRTLVGFAVFTLECIFIVPPAFLEGHGAIKFQKVRDQRIVMIVVRWILKNVANPCCCKIGLPAAAA